jgi:hypothetical protein
MQDPYATLLASPLYDFCVSFVSHLWLNIFYSFKLVVSLLLPFFYFFTGVASLDLPIYLLESLFTTASGTGSICLGSSFHVFAIVLAFHCYNKYVR